jgi:hypothetical protein
MMEGFVQVGRYSFNESRIVYVKKIVDSYSNSVRVLVATDDPDIGTVTLYGKYETDWARKLFFPEEDGYFDPIEEE